MKNIFLLISVQFQEIISSFFAKKNKDGSYQSKSIITILLLIFLLFGGLSTYYNYLFLDLLKSASLGSIYIPFIFIMATMLILMTALSRVKATLFGNKDYDLLESLPIKPYQVVTSKIIVTYLYELLFSVITMVPAIIFATVYNILSLNQILFCVLLIFLIPIIPLLIGGLFGFIFSLIFDKSKYSSIIYVILFIVFLIGIFYLFYKPNSPEAVSSMYGSMVGSMYKYYPPLRFMMDYLIENKAISILYLVLTNIGFFIGFILLVSLLYRKINARLSAQSFNNKYVSKELKNSKLTSTIIKNEFSRMFQSSTYLLNCVLGGIFSIIFVFIFYFSFKNAGKEAFDMILPQIGPFMGLCSIFGCGMFVPASVNINIEGDSFWILKTAPISGEKVIKTKILISLITSLPFGIISSILTAILFKLEVQYIIFYLIITVVFILLINLLGMATQLSHPKLYFKHENEVFKSSFAAIVTTFSAMGMTLITGLLIGLGFFLDYKFNTDYILNIFFIFIILILFIGVVIYISNLKKYGLKKYNELS